MTAAESKANFPSVTQVATQAVETNVVPGLAVAVVHGASRTTVNFGALYAPGHAGAALTQVDESTIYDLASLTKALCTSLLTMVAVAQGTLELDAQVRHWLPSAPQGITLRHLLNHSSGWPAHHKFYGTLCPDAALVAKPHPGLRSQLINLVASTPADVAPGTASTYSDLGFIALGYVVQCALNRPLDEAFEHYIARPLMLQTLRFGTRPSDLPRVAPTENCAWRQRLMVGQVHDQNAWLMGGVAGHAGLFGTATDVATVAQSLLRSHAGTPDHNDPIPTEILRYFWAHQTPASTWALGWDRPSPIGSLAGTYLSRTALGHLGFTGCSLWLDPLTQTAVVMLSNRIYPNVYDDPRFRRLRPAMMDAALADLGLA